MKKPRLIVIVEGPDGAGKSTLVEGLRRVLGGDTEVSRHGPYPGVRAGDLARIYLESMLPALWGFSNVILDRSWHSEPIYARVRRDEPSRVDAVEARMLDRVALRCGAVIVRCLPSFDACLAAFRERRPMEYLEDDGQLSEVWRSYADARFILPCIDYDRLQGYGPVDVLDEIYVMRTEPHPEHSETVGSWTAPTLVVVEPRDQVGRRDLAVRLPSVSFTPDGAWRWLSGQLDLYEVPERSMLWTSSDQPIDAFHRILYEAPSICRVAAIGEGAAKRVGALRLTPRFVVEEMPDPAFWRRCRPAMPHPLVEFVGEATSGSR